MSRDEAQGRRGSDSSTGTPVRSSEADAAHVPPNQHSGKPRNWGAAWPCPPPPGRQAWHWAPRGLVPVASCPSLPPGLPSAWAKPFHLHFPQGGCHLGGHSQCTDTTPPRGHTPRERGWGPPCRPHAPPGEAQPSPSPGNLLRCHQDTLAANSSVFQVHPAALVSNMKNPPNKRTGPDPVGTWHGPRKDTSRDKGHFQGLKRPLWGPGWGRGGLGTKIPAPTLPLQPPWHGPLISCGGRPCPGQGCRTQTLVLSPPATRGTNSSEWGQGPREAPEARWSRGRPRKRAGGRDHPVIRRGCASQRLARPLAWPGSAAGGLD